MTLQARVFEFLKSPHQRLLAHNLMILIGGELFSRVVTAVAFIYLARVFEPAVYGLVELTLAVMMILMLVVDQGLGTLGARNIARQPAETRLLVRRIVSAQTMLAITTYVLLALIVLSLPISTTLTLLLLGYGVSLLGFPFILQWVFQGQNQMVWVALPQMLRQATFAIFVLLVVRSPEQILLLPLIELVAVALAVIISVAVFTRTGNQIVINPRAGWDFGLFAESLPIGGSQLIWAIRMYLPTILVGTLAGQNEVGLFGAAHRIVMVLQTILEAYFRNLFPTMSQVAFTSMERLTKLLRNSMWLVMAPSLILALVTTLAAPMLINLTFGENYMKIETIAVLRILIWMIPILAWRRHGRNALITLNYQGEELVCSLIGVVLLGGLIFPLTLTFSGLGAAWAMIISELGTTVLIWWRAQKHLSKMKSKQSQDQFLLTDQQVDYSQEFEITPSPQTYDDKSNPIFIVGAPRSGTTLLRFMLNRHPTIGLCDETYYFYYVYTRCNAFGNLRDAEARQYLVNQYLATYRINRLGLDLELLSTTLLNEGDSYASFFLSLMRFYAVSQGKTRYGEKTPDHAMFSETLCKWYPNCKLIHLVRDPRDVVASLLRMPWASNSILTNAQLWLDYVQSAERCSFTDNYLLVRYEQLVSSPEAELARVCEFLGETYSPAMLIANESAPTDKWWFQRAQGALCTNRLGVWRQQLNSKQVALIEWAVGSYLDQFGYKPSGQVVLPRTQMAAFAEKFYDTSQQKLLNLPRILYYWLQPTQLAKEEAWIDRRV